MKKEKRLFMLSYVSVGRVRPVMRFNSVKIEHSGSPARFCNGEFRENTAGNKPMKQKQEGIGNLNRTLPGKGRLKPHLKSAYRTPRVRENGAQMLKGLKQGVGLPA